MPSLAKSVLGAFLALNVAVASPAPPLFGSVGAPPRGGPSRIPLRKGPSPSTKRDLTDFAKGPRIPHHIYKDQNLMRRQLEDLGPFAEGKSTAKPSQYQVSYMMDLVIDDHPYTLLIDTGSADTWVSSQDFQCYDRYTERPTSMEVCQLGPNFKDDFSGGEIDEFVLYIRYGIGFVNGTFGYSNIQIADISVPNVPIGVATGGSFQGDFVLNGILGLGMPDLTAGWDPLRGDYVPYDPLIATMTKSGVEPVFAMGLSRDESRSFISFGGIPEDLAREKLGEFAVTPIQRDRFGSGSEYYFYSMKPDSWTVTSSTGSYVNPNVETHIVDSGTTLNYLPYEDAVMINSLFDPPGEFSPGDDLFVVRCDATPPQFNITIGGVEIMTSPESFILFEITDGTYCASTMMYEYSDPRNLNPTVYILGDPFMQELVSVFDTNPEVMEMRFANRF